MDIVSIILAITVLGLAIVVTVIALKIVSIATGQADVDALAERLKKATAVLKAVVDAHKIP
jgi:hypothetical protein